MAGFEKIEKSNGQKPFLEEHPALINRDYNTWPVISFCATLPQKLSPYITENEFAHTIDSINQIFADAVKFDGEQVLELVFSIFTFGLSGVCYKNKYYRSLEKVSRFVNSENENVYAPKGLILVDPIITSLLCIEIYEIGASGMCKSASEKQSDISGNTENPMTQQK